MVYYYYYYYQVKELLKNT